MIILKLLFDWEGMTFLIEGNVNLLRGVFLVGEMSKFLNAGWDSLLISRVSRKGSEEGRQSTPGWGNKTKEGGIFGQKVDTMYNFGR